MLAPLTPSTGDLCGTHCCSLLTLLPPHTEGRESFRFYFVLPGLGQPAQNKGAGSKQKVLPSPASREQKAQQNWMTLLRSTPDGFRTLVSCNPSCLGERGQEKGYNWVRRGGCRAERAQDEASQETIAQLAARNIFTTSSARQHGDRAFTQNQRAGPMHGIQIVTTANYQRADLNFEPATPKQCTQPQP